MYDRRAIVTITCNIESMICQRTDAIRFINEKHYDHWMNHAWNYTSENNLLILHFVLSSHSNESTSIKTCIATVQVFLKFIFMVKTLNRTTTRVTYCGGKKISTLDLEAVNDRDKCEWQSLCGV